MTYPFYCQEKARGHGECGGHNQALGLPQCHYCYHYQRGNVEPTSPLPVPCYMTGNDGRKYAVVRWMDNMDKFWSDKHGGRGISR